MDINQLDLNGFKSIGNFYKSTGFKSIDSRYEYIGFE